MDKEMAQFKSDLLESVRQIKQGRRDETEYLLSCPANARHLAASAKQYKEAAQTAPDNLPMTGEQLAAWESSRDLAKELEQSIHEMLAGEGKAITTKRREP